MTSELHRRLWEETAGDIREAEATLLRLHQEAEKEQRRIIEMRKLQAALAPFVETNTIGYVIPLVDTPDRGDTIASPEDDARRGPLRHADVAEDILAEVGHALHLNDIIERMLVRGHPLPENPELRRSAIYSAMLRRPKVFVRLGGGNWGLARHATLGTEIPGRDFSGYGMSALADLAFESIGGPATISELVETLEKMSYKHRKDRRQTYKSIHKAIERAPDRYRKVDGSGLGTWEMIQGGGPARGSAAEDQFTLGH